MVTCCHINQVKYYENKNYIKLLESTLCHFTACKLTVNIDFPTSEIAIDWVAGASMIKSQNFSIVDVYSIDYFY